MKVKKLLATLLVGAMTLSMVACGSDGSDSGSALEGDNVDSATVGNADAEKLVVWTLAKDLQTFAEKYAETHDVQIETVVIEPADYATKVQTALNGGQTTPDIIVGEPQMLEDFYDAGYFEDLNQAPYNAQDYADQIVDYVWEVGQDSDGIQRAISYQITPAGMYYRRDIAEKVFGTDDPEEIGKLFADYNTLLDTAKTLKDAGYRIFASDAEMSYFSGDSAWVVDGKLNVAQARKDYMDLVIDLYKNDYTAYANQWSTPWYQAMAGEVPILTADIQNYADDSVNVWDADAFEEATKDLDKTEVFAFGLPSWGVLTLRDNVGETSGKWGVCSGPAYGFGGGTFIGISAYSEHKDLAWDFLKWVTLDEETAEWWIEKSEGDTVSLISVLEKHKDDENPVYGNQKLYAFWQEQAAGIDYSKVTRYDKIINDAWGNAISNIKTGAMSKEDAINEFYDLVESTYPEIEVVRE
ncbi:multiple sugar transport system substrate-binding protein [Pseudobutyrivibrio sp. YE44]|uniref:ABC transporter substrate-binding protein n=1 Tax=Pseudobutyrivibrio sp. YE44 TaxID=1520802 RepID=UPI00088738D4|nr:extracellular solute-binding protein [Pseudobutyrivibrio sp. YE44]SDB19574.1 multiple sugar transport system substrate-binding protein [Pseudobutyrivibrio sp. YE44]